MLPEQMAGCLLAGAVGDALGAPVEFRSIAAIRERYGPAGLSGFDAAYGRAGGAITDDTQMTLFTLEGLLLAGPDGDLVDAVRAAYLRWLQTQGGPPAEPAGQLLGIDELHSLRAPGHTCLSALRATAAGGAVGTVARPINNSKGCGGVMRAAPAGFLGPDLARSFTLGCDVAALTHGHPSGYLPAGVLAAAVSQILFTGASLTEAVDAASTELRRWPGHEETTAALAAGTALAAAGRPTPERLESLGGGWTGEEALAIAVCAALTGANLRDALLLAVNHSGDTDSTGAVCGNLLGAVTGPSAIPSEWLENLELREVIEAFASDAARILHRV
jgi:ADP-ribosyl-[dinitrogen reductase] hydrolase